MPNVSFETEFGQT